MPPSAPTATESLVPVIRYRNVEAAAQWLVAAFGFELKSLVHASDGAAIYAELFHGRSTIMLVPVGQSDLDAHMRQPDELGGIETQTCYLTVGEARAHLDRAIQAGANIVLPMSGETGGQQGYSCRDPEGHLWNFGTYSPASNDSAVVIPEASTIASRETPPTRRRRMVMPAVTLSLAALAAAAWALPDNPLAGTAAKLMRTASGASQTLDAGSDTAVAANQSELQDQTRQSHETILKLRQEVADARAAVIAAQNAAAAASRDLNAEHARRTEAELGGNDTAAHVQKLDADLAASKANLAHLENELLKERSARGQSVLAADAARAELQQETKKRQLLEQIVEELDRKADERLPVSTDASQPSSHPGQAVQPQANLNDAKAESQPTAAPMAAAPSETGSVAPQETAKTLSGSDAKKTDVRGGAVRRVPVERTKPVAVKKARQPSQANASAAKSTTAPRKKEDKSWPYNAW